MKEINGLPVYEKDDPCALHEYSEQMAEKVSEKIGEQKTATGNIEKQLSTINQDQERQDKEIEALKIKNTTEKSKSLHITDSSNLEGKINIFGNSEQEVRSGKNILDINSNEVYRTASTTVEINGNTINATSNNNPVTSYVSIPIEVKANTDYAFSGVAKVVSNTITDAVSVYAKVRDGKNGGSWVSGGQATINKDSTANQDLNLTFNTGSNTTVWLWLYIKSSGVTGIISIDFSNLQVEEGATKTDYEEYGASPSPEFPSDIKNVGSNVNLIKEDELLNYSTYGATATSTVIQASSTRRGYLFKCKPNTIYTIQRGDIEAPSFRAFCFDENPIENLQATSTNGAYADTLAGSVGKKISFKTTQNSKYIYVVTSTNEYTTPNVKAEEGELATSYSHYNCENIVTTASGENIVSGQEVFENMYNFYSTGLTEVTEDGKDCIRFNNTRYRPQLGFNFKDYPYKEKASYTIRLLVKSDGVPESTTGALSINILYTDGTYSGVSLKASEATAFTELRAVSSSDKTINKIGFSYGTSNYWFLDKQSVFIAEGDTTNYSTYEGEKVLFPLEEGQRLMLGDYLGEDEKIHHVRKQIELDGTENLQLRSKNDDGTYTYSLSTIIDYKHTRNMQAICSHFENLGTTNSVASMKTKGIGFSFYYNAGATTTSALYLNTTIETVEELIAWLTEQKEAGTPVILEYELAEEEETEDFTENQKTAYKELQNAKTYKTITNITTEENMALIEAEYTADPKTYIDNKASEIKEQLNVINELLSTTKTSAKLLDNLKSDLESEVL